MLNKRNLDDQTYESIVEAAKSRLPWLCPEWTDYNAHDPGITVLELMAWYKEMQQYQMNQFTPALKERLLKLAGVRRRPASPARCAVALEEEGPARLALSRLATPEGIPFELEDPVPLLRPRIRRVRAGGVELWEMLQAGGLTFQPFASAREPELQVGLDRLGAGALRLWFQVEEPSSPRRNPFLRPGQHPRSLSWTLGETPVQPLEDQTHSLSQSGFVVLPLPPSSALDKDGLCWLTVRQTDPGCEETVRLSGLSVSRWRAVQRETWARSHALSAPAEEGWTVLLPDALARDGELAVFLRTGGGWTQTAAYTARRGEEGLTLTLDAREALVDGAANVLAVCLDPARAPGLLLDSSGLPGQTAELRLEGRSALPEPFALLCETLDTDGAVRLLPWTRADDLYAAGPRDRVFVYDPVRETLTFGDGLHGAVPRRGEGAILVTDLALSWCEGGNIPASAGLRFREDGRPADNTAAQGGRGRETADQAAARFLRELEHTEKCASAADYERLALTTPGLRVGAAKALPGYDPDEPTGVTHTPTVTVVVAPASDRPRPLPDGRFLAEAARRLEERRPICTQVKVVAPVYVPIRASVRLRGRDTVTEAAVRALLEEYLSPRGAGIGGPVRPGEAAALLQALPGVLQVKGVDLRALGTGCYQNAAGDIQLPRLAIPCLDGLELDRTPEEFLDR